MLAKLFIAKSYAGCKLKSHNFNIIENLNTKYEEIVCIILEITLWLLRNVLWRIFYNPYPQRFLPDCSELSHLKDKRLMRSQIVSVRLTSRWFCSWNVVQK